MKKTCKALLVFVLAMAINIASAATVSLVSYSSFVDGGNVTFTGYATDRSSVTAVTSYTVTPCARTASAYGYYYDINGNKRTVSDAAGDGTSVTVSKTVYCPSARSFYMARTVHNVTTKSGTRVSRDSGEIRL